MWLNQNLQANCLLFYMIKWRKNTRDSRRHTQNFQYEIQSFQIAFFIFLIMECRQFVLKQIFHYLGSKKMFIYAAVVDNYCLLCTCMYLQNKIPVNKSYFLVTRLEIIMLEPFVFFISEPPPSTKIQWRRSNFLAYFRRKIEKIQSRDL